MGVQDGAYPNEGKRTVRKGGKILFDGFVHCHPLLADRVGKWVWCVAHDIWGGGEIGVFECRVYPGGRYRKTDRLETGEFICNAPAEPLQETHA